MVRNSTKYVPTKDYKAFTAQLKKIYGAVGLKAANADWAMVINQLTMDTNIHSKILKYEKY
ncbi:Uncharacterised protein [Chlamydia trachomatis]|nr:Uncharacterised protein [Chlamydia trachomatis]